MNSTPKNNEPTSSESPSLAANFNKYFRIRVANTKALREKVFEIRHDVYCRELGWEEQQKSNTEVDEFDDYSYYCLLEHIATNTFAGCVRIVIPPANQLDLKTPFETHCLSSVRSDVIDFNKLPRGSFGEVSRLAVPEAFRRRRNEANKPFSINGIGGGHVFTDEERRNFPSIAVGLYLAILKLAQLCNHQVAFVMMEPRLNRRLKRFGFPFTQAGDVIEYHGSRALFALTSKDSMSQLNPELMELYQSISAQVSEQTTLIPYTDPADR
ncbi:MAG: PEP-CTERM/exosortase system-associated acyltransferase [Gammaproteobacteria bacterium]|nr:PEP-CTERM/exosortase system-associated acyltransferase [Gammaproteobacteria bacterium]